MLQNITVNENSCSSFANSVSDENTKVFLHLKWGLERVNLIIAFYRYLSSSEKHLKNSGLNGDPKPDLCNAGAVLYQLSSQANWELVITWVDYTVGKPIEKA